MSRVNETEYKAKLVEAFDATHVRFCYLNVAGFYPRINLRVFEIEELGFKTAEVYLIHDSGSTKMVTFKPTIEKETMEEILRLIRNGYIYICVQPSEDGKQLFFGFDLIDRNIEGGSNIGIILLRQFDKFTADMPAYFTRVSR